jgi:hypothetical protein
MLRKARILYNICHVSSLFHLLALQENSPLVIQIGNHCEEEGKDRKKRKEGKDARQRCGFSILILNGSVSVGPKLQDRGTYQRQHHVPDRQAFIRFPASKNDHYLP